jgi:hypothetical protein
MAQPFLSRRNCATFFWLDSGFRGLLCVGLDCRAAALIAAKLKYTRPDQERGTMKCVACSSSKLCDAIPACAVTTVPFSCRPSLHRLRRSLSRPRPLTNNGSGRHDTAVSLRPLPGGLLVRFLRNRSRDRLSGAATRYAIISSGEKSRSYSLTSGRGF